jgi:surface polysaccharide O-acyltransferase-like enzyme
MGYAAIALATLGLGLGLTSRVWALFPVVLMLFLATVTLAMQQALGLMEATLYTVLAQLIIQACYFVGLVVRVTFGPPRQPAVKLASKSPARTFGDLRAHRLGRRAT